MIKDHSHAIETLSNCLPYFHLAKDFDFTNSRYLRFVWRDIKYRLDLNNDSVEEVQGHLLAGTDNAILMSALIKKTIYPNINFIQQ